MLGATMGSVEGKLVGELEVLGDTEGSFDGASVGDEEGLRVG